MQAPVPAQIIDKGIPTSGLLAQVLVAKYADHLPLYRHSGIFERAGLAIPDSTLAEWVGRCGVALQPLVDALKEYRAMGKLFKYPEEWNSFKEGGAPQSSDYEEINVGEIAAEALAKVAEGCGEK